MTLRRIRHSVGFAYLLLSVGTFVGALLIVQRYRLGVLPLVASMLMGLPSAFLSFVSYRADRIDGKRTFSTEEIVRDLADVVKRQWDAEVQLRRLNDPHPLPVSWTLADPELQEPWDRLLITFNSWPRRHPARLGTVIPRPETLVEPDIRLSTVLDRIPTGRLVLLGEPGSGKSVLLIQLLLDLLVARGGMDPVPVILTMASWNPKEQALHAWIADRLLTDYPSLLGSVPYEAGDSWVQQLLDRQLLVPILDGLDEMPGHLRRLAVVRINDALRPYERLVVSCRLDEYRDLICQDSSGYSLRIRAAAGIVLGKLADSDVKTYLERDAGTPPEDSRWKPILDHIGKDTPVGNSLKTPLMVSLLRLTFDPRPGEGEDAPPCGDPAYVCDESQFPTAQAVGNWLFDAFVTTAYRRLPGADPAPWDVARSMGWLQFLARHLQTSCGGGTRLVWWELERAVSDIPLWLVPVFTTALVCVPLGAMGAAGRTGAFAVSLAVAVLIGFTTRNMTRFNDGLLRGLAVGSLAGFVGGLFGGLLFGGLSGGITNGIAVGLWVGGVFGETGGIFGGLAGGFVGGILGDIYLGSMGGGIDGFALALLVGIVVIVRRRTIPAWGPEWSPLGAAVGSLVGLGVGLAMLVVSAPLSVLPLIVALGLLTGLVAGFTGIAPDLNDGFDQRAVLIHDRGMFVVSFLLVGTCAGLGNGVVTGVMGGWWKGLVCGVGLGAGTGVAFAFAHSAWGTYQISRCCLALQGKIPWRLMAFLADAHENRGILRRIGTIYEFRHLELQRHLAGVDRE